MADEFDISIAKWVDRQKARKAEYVQAFGENLVTRLKEHTPVVTGNLRARWHVAEITEDHLLIVNDAAYARRVNFGFNGKDSLGRSYHQRGSHIVEQTLVDVAEIARQTEEDLKS